MTSRSLSTTTPRCSPSTGHDLPRGRLDQHRRFHRQHLWRVSSPPSPPPRTRYLQKFMSWADERRQLKVLTNADNPADAQNAIDMGAEGIGLCRTEHMFFDRRPHQGRPRDDLRHHCGGPQGRSGQGRALSAAAISTEMYRIMGDRPMTIRYPGSASARVPAHQARGHRASWPRTWA